VLGNTDELLWRPDEQARLTGRAPALATLLRWLFEAYAPDTRQRLGDERLAWLRQLPRELRIEDVTIVHAAPGDLWRAPMPDAEDHELENTYRPLHARTAVYGHIHRPFIRTLATMRVANAGSAGLPWDGDNRASYVLIDGHSAQVIRVAYDIEAEARELITSAHPDAERLAEMRRTGSFVAPGTYS
jgi:hypothetical protein